MFSESESRIKKYKYLNFEYNLMISLVCCVFHLYLIVFFIFFLVQGSHRDSTKQNKDLSLLTQQQPNSAPSNNLNNPSATKNSPVTTTAADSDVNKSGPYFDVAASKNVRINFKFYRKSYSPQILILIQNTHFR